MRLSTRYPRRLRPCSRHYAPFWPALPARSVPYTTIILMRCRRTLPSASTRACCTAASIRLSRLMAIFISYSMPTATGCAMLQNSCHISCSGSRPWMGCSDVGPARTRATHLLATGAHGSRDTAPGMSDALHASALLPPGLHPHLCPPRVRGRVACIASLYGLLSRWPADRTLNAGHRPDQSAAPPGR
jgi:hypothetical protein